MKRYVAALLAFFVMLMPLPANAVDVCLPGVKVGSVIQLEQQCIVRLGDAPTLPPIPRPTTPRPPVTQPTSQPKPQPKPAAPKSSSPKQETPQRAVTTQSPRPVPSTPQSTKKPEKQTKTDSDPAVSPRVVEPKRTYLDKGQELGLGILLVASGFGLGYLVFYRKPNHLTPPSE